MSFPIDTAITLLIIKAIGIATHPLPKPQGLASMGRASNLGALQRPLPRTKPRPPEQGASAAARSERKGLQRVGDRPPNGCDPGQKGLSGAHHATER
nr:MAG TPA: hypothetical protein [Caudoviricetes sp.]